MIKVLTRVLAVAGAVVLVLLGTAGTGWAHPFGPPPVAKVRAEGSLVEVTWSAAADDVAALNRADRAGGSIGDYLGRGVGVEQDGRACPLVEVSAQALATTGAVLRFRCPGPAGELRLRVELLTDLDRAYRTVSVTPSGSGALHTADAPVQTIRWTARPPPRERTSTGSSRWPCWRLSWRAPSTRALRDTARRSPPGTCWAGGPGPGTRSGSGWSSR